MPQLDAHEREALRREWTTLPAAAAATRAVIGRLLAEPVTAADPSGTRWLTPGEVAARFRVAERTVRAWCARGLLAAVQLGGPRGVWRIDAHQFSGSSDDVARFLAVAHTINHAHADDGVDVTAYDT